MKHERRTVAAAEIRAPDDGTGTFEAIVLRYGVIDDYNTRFRAGCFTESLSTRLPRICWAHRWDEPLGRYVDYRDTPDALTLVGEFDDFDAVPRARQAHAQLRSGTIDQFSVGFMRLADEAVDPEQAEGQRGVVDITRGQLDEVSLVLVGAVPGTELVGVRMVTTRSGLTVPYETLEQIAKRKAAGELTDAEADALLELAAKDNGGGGGEPGPDAETAEEIEAALAEADDALGDLEG